MAGEEAKQANIVTITFDELGNDGPEILDKIHNVRNTDQCTF